MMRNFYILPFLLSTLLFGEGIDQADTYNQNSNLQWEWATGSIARYPFVGTERVLDIGCGDGKITALLAERVSGGTVIGMDVSSKMIEFASNSFTAENLFFLEGGAASIPFYEQFDLIFSTCCLHWVNDQEAALKNIHQALRPGGKVLLIVPAKNFNNLSRVAHQLIETEKWLSYFPDYQVYRFYFTAEEYVLLLKQAGFHSIQTEVTTIVSSYKNRDALKEWLRPLVTFTAHLSKDLQEEFLEDLTSLELSLCYRDERGVIQVPSLKLEMIADK